MISQNVIRIIVRVWCYRQSFDLRHRWKLMPCDDSNFILSVAGRERGVAAQIIMLAVDAFSRTPAWKYACVEKVVRRRARAVSASVIQPGRNWRFALRDVALARKHTHVESLIRPRMLNSCDLKTLRTSSELKVLLLLKIGHVQRWWQFSWFSVWNCRI